MKRLILTAVMLLGLAFSAQAQEIRKNALGLRIGDNEGFGGEISYQRALGDNNRLELDLGWRDSKYYDATKIVGLYQWVWNIDGGFNWYAGVGGGLGSYSFHDDYDFPGDDDGGTFALLAGDIGIEYVFDIPLQVSLDLRPELYFGDEFRDDNFGPDVALGVRFTF
ncbi:MAG TPA: hypothetical protein VF676_03950 [Flavobacterium sp.]|jgi:hypothetical protein